MTLGSEDSDCLPRTENGEPLRFSETDKEVESWNFSPEKGDKAGNETISFSLEKADLFLAGRTRGVDEYLFLIFCSSLLASVHENTQTVIKVSQTRVI